MRDHGLFQAICRVNRLDGDDKEYGYIVDYKDLFRRLEGALIDYTSGALDGYDAIDVAGLLSDRLEKARDRLDETLETVRALCEPVSLPRDTRDYLHYFCAEDTADKTALATNEPKRVALYEAVAALLRAYANLANEMPEAGYNPPEIAEIQAEVEHYTKVRQEVKVASSDYLDMKQFEPAMRHLLDSYIRADESEKISEFEDLGLLELIVKRGTDALDSLPSGIKNDPAAVAETIENNIRRTIIDENPVNPRYYEQMSELLDALIQQRRENAIDYQQYLEKIKQLAQQVIQPGLEQSNYPPSIDTNGKRSLYDNLGQDEDLALRIDHAVRYTKKEGWVSNRFKEREITKVVREAAVGYNVNVDDAINLIKNQHEYQ
jgi:type I restriction enzyme, R subunit